MLWIGLTGAMGSGKSTVAEILRERGYVVLDADGVVRSVLGRGGLAEADVRRAFPETFGADGALDRRALGRRVFSDVVALATLESILHPRVREEVRRLKAALNVSVAFYDVPLLFEKQMESQFDFVLVVHASEEVRRSRLAARTGLSVEEINARFANQLSPDSKRARASAVIENDAGLAELRGAVTEALRALKIPPP